MRPYRKERIARAVRNIVSEAIAQRMHDPRVEPLTSVTRVEVTGDLQIARVFLVVPGTEATQRRTMAAIQSAAGWLQRLVAGELRIRQCPELRFEIDRGAKEARATLKLLEENRRNYPELFEDVGQASQPETSVGPASSRSDDRLEAGPTPGPTADPVEGTDE